MSQKAIVTLEANLKDDCIDNFFYLLSKYLPETKMYDGFISIKIHQCTTENTIVLHQEWESITHYEAYLRWRTDNGVMHILRANFTSDPIIKYWNTVIV
ncbi:putative quinol monooxygenase [Kordia sp.]|uniref:putative quinol monooxygenase n=1 Tax=Kordia sp. TaxID=1965332 RepID=UPI003B5A9FBB